MTLPFPRLFASGKIGSMQVKNRIVKCPTLTMYCNRDGSVSHRLVRFYEEIAAGGSGLVIVEFTHIDNKGSKPHENTLALADDSFLTGLSLLAQRIQENGAKAGLQLCHAGAQRAMGTPIMAPSSKPDSKVMYTNTPMELSVEEILEIEEAFGDAALRVRKAGFDIVEIHAGHGYLITEFLSPLTNRRSDLYGGGLEGRMRFLLRIIDNVRKKIGFEFPLSVRLTGTEYVEGGIRIEDTIQISKQLENATVNVLHISGGSRYTRGDTIVAPMYNPQGLNIWAAEAIKRAVTVPIIASGSITTPALGERILVEGKADFIGLGRPLLADPFLPRKAREGLADDIMPCIRCNEGCNFMPRRGFGGVRCTVNVGVGKEENFRLKPARRPRKVAIVGGGPAGLEAARVAALMGHEVTLFEKRDLGGHLIEASIPEFKNDLRRLLEYYVRQISKLNITLIKREANVDDLRGDKFEAIIVAVGSIPLSLQIPGIKRFIVQDALDVFCNSSNVGESVAVIGGGLVGCDVSLFLAELGKKVTLIETLNEIGAGMETCERQAFRNRIADRCFQVHTGASVKEILAAGVMLLDKDGRSRKVEADNVVLSVGFAPATLNGLEEIEFNTIVRRVGDCLSPRKLFDAIHEGHLAVRTL